MEADYLGVGEVFPGVPFSCLCHLIPSGINKDFLEMPLKRGGLCILFPPSGMRW
jgi:hypothetical protein